MTETETTETTEAPAPAEQPFVAPAPVRGLASFDAQTRADAEAAFTAYNANGHNLTWDGREVPPWSALQGKPQAAHWCAAVERIAPQRERSAVTCERALLSMSGFVGRKPAELVSGKIWQRLVGLADRERAGKDLTDKQRTFVIKTFAAACSRLAELD